MELDELKSHWKRLSGEENQRSVHASKIHEMITMRSKSFISSATIKVRNKARAASTVGTLSLVLSLVMLFMKEEGPSFLSEHISNHTLFTMLIFMSFFVLVVAWFNRQQFLKLRALETSASNIREALTDTILRIRSVMRASILSDSIGAPIIVCWITYIQLYWDTGFIWDIRMLSLTVITAFSIPILHLIAKSGQRAKYGTHLTELERCLAELDSPTSEA
ncbi:MAG: hypothetical protein R8G66_09665 [Cytophagales bacterium]|nr:hypothetical protein [Cytophagales bacterium]